MEVDLHSSQSENESGTKCWLTNLFNLSLQQFYLAQENLKQSVHYETFNRHCAFCLTCGNKALGRRANDLTKNRRKFCNNFEPLLPIDLNFLKTRQQTIQVNISNVERTQVNYKNLRITKKKNSHICSAINLFQLHCR